MCGRRRRGRTHVDGLARNASIQTVGLGRAVSRLSSRTGVAVLACRFDTKRAPRVRAARGNEKLADHFGAPVAIRPQRRTLHAHTVIALRCAAPAASCPGDAACVGDAATCAATVLCLFHTRQRPGIRTAVRLVVADRGNARRTRRVQRRTRRANVMGAAPAAATCSAAAVATRSAAARATRGSRLVLELEAVETRHAVA